MFPIRGLLDDVITKYIASVSRGFRSPIHHHRDVYSNSKISPATEVRLLRDRHEIEGDSWVPPKRERKPLIKEEVV
jgi:hypothetical protein